MSTYVIFFGGWRATPADMQAWKNDAKRQRKDVDFDAIPWPTGVESSQSAIKAFTNPKTGGDTKAIADIQSSKADKIYIVGHSSGCAIANDFDMKLVKGKLVDPKKIVLVALDGFAPEPEQLARLDTQVWVARTSRGESTTCIPKKGQQDDDICISMHYKTMKNHLPLQKHGGSRLKIHYAASNCTNPWALHFSLVNCAANDTTVKVIVQADGKTDAAATVAQGYKPCNANLVWL